MTWLKKIINEMKPRSFTQKTKNKADIDDIKYVSHDETAFRPGDKVRYTRNSGHGVFDTYGIITDNDGKLIYFYKPDDETKEVYHKSLFDADGRISRQIKHCESWLRPVKEANCWMLTSESYVVSYEISDNLKVTDKHYPKDGDVFHTIPDGMELIVVWQKQKGNKQYYTWPDGEFVGGVSTTVENLSNRRLLPKINEPEPKPVNVDKCDMRYYVMIPPEKQACMLVKENGSFYAWNFNFINYIIGKCPWLLKMAAPWASSVGGPIKTCAAEKFMKK